MPAQPVIAAQVAMTEHMWPRRDAMEPSNVPVKPHTSTGTAVVIPSFTSAHVRLGRQLRARSNGQDAAPSACAAGPAPPWRAPDPVAPAPAAGIAAGQPTAVPEYSAQ